MISFNAALSLTDDFAVKLQEKYDREKLMNAVDMDIVSLIRRFIQRSEVNCLAYNLFNVYL